MGLVFYNIWHDKKNSKEGEILSKRDYYEILEISKEASAEEIKRAYRKKALKYHPDRNSGDKEAEERFKELNEAYEILSNPQKKDRYDRFGHAGVDPNASGGFSGAGFGGFEDIFSDIFDMFGGGFSSGRRRNGPMKGSDLQQRVSITFEEAAFGTEKDITITRNEKCSDCDGTGAEKNTEKTTCPKCNGSGEIRVQQRTPFGQFVNVKVCDRCGGKGTIIENPCKTCQGSGKVRRKVSLKVKIPAGVDDESVISLRGEGEPGLNGGPNGDLYVVISVRAHKIFKREGSDLLLEIPITFPQAALGDELVVPILDGKITYKVPAGTQSETVFRIKGKGIKHLNSSKTGDLYVKVVVEIPKKLTNEQKKLLNKLSESFDSEGHEQRKSFLENVKDLLGI